MTTKKLLIIFIIIAALGWSGAVYFYKQKKDLASELAKSREVSLTVIDGLKTKIDRGRSYVDALGKFELFRQNKFNSQAVEDLKTAVEATNNGGLQAALDDILLSGYKEQDMRQFMDILTDALGFFWR